MSRRESAELRSSPGRLHVSPPRVASLLPSATEMVCALGAREALVGVSHECDFPAGVRGLPVLTRTAVRSLGSSAAIDRDVRRVLREALAVYEVDTAALAEVRPDVIVTQDLCEVCAVSFRDVQRAAREVLGPDVRIVDLHPLRLGDVFDDLERVAHALGVEASGRRVRRGLEERVAAVGERSAALGARPAVLTIEWLDPLMIGGTWMPELVALAGGRALVTSPGERAPTLAAHELAALDPAPEVVLVKPCGFDLAQTLRRGAELERLFAGLEWPAKSDRRVFVADGNAYFNRPGPRIVDSLEILAACVHPAAFEDLGRAHAGGFVRLGD